MQPRGPNEPTTHGSWARRPQSANGKWPSTLLYPHFCNLPTLTDPGPNLLLLAAEAPGRTLGFEQRTTT